MGTAHVPEPVKLVVSAFAPSQAFLAEAKTVLVAEWGAVDFESEPLPFDHTAYYEREFGSGLERLIWAFERLIDPSTLADVKTRTNELEQRWLVDGQRRVNLDSGYLSLSKLVLATTKDHAHRIYVGRGIYAEVTLRYQDGAFRPWPWTYPDYASTHYCALFATIRQRYLAQLRAEGRS